MDKVMGREPPEPVEIGERQGVEEEPFQPEDEHVEIEQAIKDELIKQYSYLIDYKMVYTVDPNHRLLILRFPNRRRDEDYFGDNNQPMELRIKPKCGQVELDVPLNFKLPETDHQRMMKLQQAVHKSLILQKGESYGLAGGFGVNEEPKPSKKNNGKSKEKETTESPEPNDDEPGPPKKKKGKAKEKETSKSPEPDDEDEGVPHWPLKKITLGGMIQRYDDTKPRLMVGTFKGNVLYLSHVDAVVELTVNFQHLDALSDLNKSSDRHTRNTEKGRQMERDYHAAHEKAEARAEAKEVNVAVKSTEPDEGMPEGRTKLKQLLQDIADEPWQRMKLYSHDDEESYRVFDEHFGLDKDTDHLPDLISTMSAKQWLDSISCPRYDHTQKRYREMTFPGNPGEEGLYGSDASEEDDEEEEWEEGEEGEGEGEGEYDSDEDDEDEASESQSDTSWETLSSDAHL